MRARYITFRSLSIVALSIFFVFLLAGSVSAKSKQLNTAVEESLRFSGESAGVKVVGEEATDPRIFIANFLRIFLMGYGIVFIALMVYAGYSLITSHGVAEKEENAHKTIRNAIIGLIVVMSSYGLSRIAAKSAIEATGFGDTPHGIEMGEHQHCCANYKVGDDGRTTVYYDPLDKDACDDLHGLFDGQVDRRGRTDHSEYLGYIPVNQCK